MSFLGKIGSGIAKFGSIAQKALKPLGSIAAPAAGLVSGVASAFLPKPIGDAVSGAASKVAEFVSSGKAADIAGAIGAAGARLAGAAMNPMPQS